jgi:hypothetical protein
MTTTKQTQLGSISTGTLRPEALLEAFASALNGLDKAHPLIAEALDLVCLNDWTDKQNELASELINELSDALNNLCPPFVYFGNLEGDGADFGFWADRDRLNEELQWERDHYPDDSVPDELTLDDHGVIVQVSDHGGVTVMDPDRNVLWSVA